MIAREGFPYRVAGFKQRTDSTPYEKRRIKQLSAHLSLVGAVAQAGIFRRSGWLVWIERHDRPASILEKSRNPSVSARLANRAIGAR